MTFMKVNNGLFVEPSNCPLDDNDKKIKEVEENPIVLALDKVKLKPRTPFDLSGHSRVVSRA